MSTERGFTLLEVLVALAIFATLGAAVLSATQTILRQGQMLEQRLLAAWVLDNHLQAIRLEPALLRGPPRSQVRLAGRDWRIEQRVAKTPGLALWHVELRTWSSTAPATAHRLDGWLEQQP